MKVAYVYIGILANSSRALKQLEELRQLGAQIDVFVGNENHELQNYTKFNFNVYEFSIVHGGPFKVKSLINPLLFCYKVYKKIKNQCYDFVICQELTTFPSGFLIKENSKDTKLVFDNNELSVERYSGIKKIIWSYIQNKVLSSADTIIHAENNRMKYFINKYNLDEKSQKLVCNYPHRNKKKILKFVKEVRVIYLGVIHPNRQIEELIDAFSSLNEKLSLDIVGPGEKKYLDFIKSKVSPFKNINLLPSVPQTEINTLLSNYSIGIAFYSNSNLNNYYCAPNKVFQYINNKLAVITNDYPGLIDVVRKNKIGICLNKLDTKSLRSAVTEISQKKLNENISDDIILKYNWESQKKEFISIFK
jgi:glycosyltransferase involved in cell wall biosynthesis